MTPATQELAGRIAVVTGASGAIGMATAELLLARGARVALVARDGARLDAVAGRLGPGALTVAADATDEQSLNQAREHIRDRLGQPSLVFPFAGGNGNPVPTSVETADHWRSVLESDLTSTFLTVRAFLSDLIAHPDAAIVTISSTAAIRSGKANAAYAVAKAGVIGLTRHLAQELGPDGVRVNCLVVGAIENERWRGAPAEHRARATQRVPLGRLGQPADVAETAVFLAGPRSGWTTGATVSLDGGTAL